MFNLLKLVIIYIIFIISKIVYDFEFTSKKINKAMCVLTNNEPGIEGNVLFEQLQKGCKITVNIKGLTPGKHGFHIHNKGDLTEGCKSLCSHYNPFNKVHGEHVGDLGNIVADDNGVVKQVIIGKDIELNGPISVIGRSVIVHQDEDDLGLGGNEESLKTGNAGKRIACGVIGISEEL